MLDIAEETLKHEEKGKLFFRYYKSPFKTLLYRMKRKVSNFICT